MGENQNIPNATFEKVLAAFHDYLTQDDCVEVTQTSRGYAVIEWDDLLGNWTEIEHCPSPTDLQQALLEAMASFLEYCYTSGDRELTEVEKEQITQIQAQLSFGFCQNK